MDVQDNFFVELPVDDLAIDELSRLALQLDLGLWRDVAKRKEEFKKASYKIWKRSGFEQPLGSVLEAYLLNLPVDNSAAAAELRSFIKRIHTWKPKQKG